MMQFLSSHLSLVIVSVFGCLLAVGGLCAIRSFMVSQRLHHLSVEVILRDPDTFHQTHVIACRTCKSKRHVSHYCYGRGNEEQSVYLCYLCLPRLERTIRDAYQASQTMHPQEQPKDAYAQFQAWTGQGQASHAPSSTMPDLSYRHPVQHPRKGR